MCTDVQRVFTTRLDRSAIERAHVTDAGALRVPAVATRVGVFDYGDHRELRLPEEVFSEESLRSLRGVTLTRDHPASRLVTPESWRRVAIGHVEEPRRDGDLLRVTVVIQDRAAIEDVRAGKLRELSCGYVCALEEQKGTQDGEAYHAIQRGIRHNHLALGPVGWARAGRVAHLNMDGRNGATNSGDGGGLSRVRLAVLKDRVALRPNRVVAAAAANLDSSRPPSRGDIGLSRVQRAVLRDRVALRPNRVVAAAAANLDAARPPRGGDGGATHDADDGLSRVQRAVLKDRAMRPNRGKSR